MTDKKTATVDLSQYKKTLKELKVTHQMVAEYTGRTREHVTLMLNGLRIPPVRVALHLAEEIEELIAKYRQK